MKSRILLVLTMVAGIALAAGSAFAGSVRVPPSSELPAPNLVLVRGGHTGHMGHMGGMRHMGRMSHMGGMHHMGRMRHMGGMRFMARSGHRHFRRGHSRRGHFRRGHSHHRRHHFYGPGIALFPWFGYSDGYDYDDCYASCRIDHGPRYCRNHCYY